MKLWRVDLHNSDRDPDSDYTERLGNLDDGFLHFRTEEEARSFARRLIPHLPFRTPYIHYSDVAQPLQQACHKGTAFVVAQIVEGESQDQEGDLCFYRRAPIDLLVYEVTPEKKNPGEPYEPRSQKLVLQTRLRKRKKDGRTEYVYEPAQEGEPVWGASQAVSVYPIELEEFDGNEKTMTRVHSFLLRQR